MARRRVLRYFPATIRVDDADIAVRIARLDVDQMTALDRDYKRMSDPPSNRLVFVRRDTPEEQEKNEKGYVIPLTVIGERRLQEMTLEQRAAYDKQDAIDESFAKKLLIDTITAYVTVDPDQLEEEDGTEVTTGRQMLKLYGGRRDVLTQLLVAVYGENTMSEASKKVSRSLFDLKRSWEQQLPVADGPKPDSPADAAVNAASAEPGDATASEPETPSGSAPETEERIH